MGRPWRLPDGELLARGPRRLRGSTPGPRRRPWVPLDAQAGELGDCGLHSRSLRGGGATGLGVTGFPCLPPLRRPGTRCVEHGVDGTFEEHVDLLGDDVGRFGDHRVRRVPSPAHAESVDADTDKPAVRGRWPAREVDPFALRPRSVSDCSASVRKAARAVGRSLT